MSATSLVACYGHFPTRNGSKSRIIHPRHVLATVPLSYFSLAPATALLAGRLFCSLIKLLNAVLPVVVFTRAAVICKTVVLLRFYLKECGTGCSLNAVVAQQSCLSKSHGGVPVCYEEAGKITWRSGGQVSYCWSRIEISRLRPFTS